MADKKLLDEIKKRRTFAIISHPDAGKTTITVRTSNGKMASCMVEVK